MAAFFGVLHEFLKVHPSIEIDVCESVLNGGWEALEQGRVDLIVGSPGPVPAQKGYRAIPLVSHDLVPVIATSHELAEISTKPNDAEALLPKIRRVITHDTSTIDVTRSAGLSSDGKHFYVQNIDQKTEAILAGIGIGHLPRKRIQEYLDNGKLIALHLQEEPAQESFMAWRISHKGKGLQMLTQELSTVFSGK